jgi:hypothetical protein
MPATIRARTETTVTIQIEIPLSRSMLESEGTIQQALNEAGLLASAEALQQFDTDGSAIHIGSSTWTSKGQEPKAYQTPYGEVSIDRHVYQTSAGGATFCPLERDARIILTSTPLFAKQVSSKYAEMPGGRVVNDLRENHRREVSLCLVQDLAGAVGGVAMAKEESWHYATPKVSQPACCISVGLDGTCVFLVEDGYRQAMVGTLSLYDYHGERLHTTYLAATPEYGKQTFYERLAREIDHVRKLYPHAQLTAVADGSEDNWTFLRQHTSDECIDFYHATGYLAMVAQAKHPRNPQARQAWLDGSCHRLKHEDGAAKQLLAEMSGLPTQGLSQAAREGLAKARTYFTNHHQQMKYAQRRKDNKPIGSGVTEAACKTLVKMRLGRTGAKWKEEGAAIVLSLRSLVYTAERWQQFWQKVDRYGFPIEIAA